MFDFVVKMHEGWRNFKILSNTNIKGRLSENLNREANN